jgi:large subunit ribosomal protein L25
MLQFDLTAQVRDTFGKGASRRLRMGGLTPVILYGNKTEAVSLQMDTKELTQILLKVQRRNALFNLYVKGTGHDDVCHHVMVKEIQTEPVSDALVHADFCALSLEEPMVFTVPVTFVGKAKGVDMGGDMTVFVRSLVLKGRPLDIPELIEKDITDLGLDEKLTCADFAIPAGVELLSGKDTVAISVAMPVVVAVVEESPAAGKGKKKK